MKRALTSAPVLGYRRLHQTLHRGDRYKSCLMSQEQDWKQRVIAYASRRLRPSEKNCSLYSSMKL